MRHTPDERRERLIRILMLRGKASLAELANELEVSERTVMRDVDLMSTSRPIFSLPGKGGGIFLVDTYSIYPHALQKSEAALLQKIISEAEQTSVCRLEYPEIKILKDILEFYSSKRNMKGKRK